MKNLKNEFFTTSLVFILTFILFIPQDLLGQDVSSKYDLLFTSGKVQPNVETTRKQFKTGAVVYDTRTYKILQFNDIPTESEKTSPKTIINIDEKFSKGVYIITVRIDGKIYTQRLIID